MKGKIFLCAVVVLAFSCNEKNDPPKVAGATTTSTDKAPVSFPLPVSYSSSFEMGNPAYAKMIVQGSWKDWQDNTMDHMKNWVADTVELIGSDAKVIRGADSVIANWKRGRAAYTNVVDTIDAVMPVYSTDKKENWVLVWATEMSTKDGVRDTVSEMETWRINKDGKADMVLQYDRHRRKK